MVAVISQHRLGQTTMQATCDSITRRTQRIMIFSFPSHFLRNKNPRERAFELHIRAKFPSQSLQIKQRKNCGVRPRGDRSYPVCPPLPSWCRVVYWCETFVFPMARVMIILCARKNDPTNRKNSSHFPHLSYSVHMITLVATKVEPYCISHLEQPIILTLCLLRGI